MILDWKESWENEKNNRKSVDPKRICTFGIKPLDDALIGFLPDDLIVIGADSGTGKSHIALDIALHNAMNGRNVALYSIEGNDEAAISRIKWKVMRQMYYESKRTDIEWNFRQWRMNLENNPIMDKLEADALAAMEQKIGERLHMYHCDETFSITDFKNSLGWFLKSKTNHTYMLNETYYDIDLLIIDHLQYFTFDNPMNELGETTEILKAVKNLAEHHRIPVLLISHLRKKEKNRGLPNQEDLFGTSNIAKICSQCVVIAPCSIGVDYVHGTYPTFFRFVKSRTGLKSNFAILSDFESNHGAYAPDYKMFYVHDNIIKDEFKSHQLPLWAYKPPVMAQSTEATYHD